MVTMILFFGPAIMSAQDVSLGQIQGWLVIIGFILLWGGVLWRTVKQQAKSDAAMEAAIAKATSDAASGISKVATDVDRVGEKINKIESACGISSSDISRILIEQQQSRDDRGIMRERVAMNAAAIKDIQQNAQDDRLAVMSTLHNNEKAAAERDAQLRERLATMAAQLDIERMVTSVVRAVNNANNSRGRNNADDV